MAKPGPKPKIGQAERAQVLAILKVGGTLKDAADIIGVTSRTLYNLRAKNREFFRGVLQAEKSGKLRHLKKIGRAKDWRSSAWYLERKYGQEFGRKDKIEHTGNAAEPIETVIEHKHTFDFNAFASRFNEFAGRHGGATPPPNGN